MTTTAGARAAKESDCVPPALRWLPIHARATAAARITATLPHSDGFIDMNRSRPRRRGDASRRRRPTKRLTSSFIVPLSGATRTRTTIGLPLLVLPR